MNISTRRMVYILEKRTQQWLSSISGIPQSTISRVKNNQINLPTKYASALRNVYQKEAYGNLKIVGASASQAKRFSWYIPETVKDVQSTLQETRSMLEVAWLARKSMETGELLSGDALTNELKLAEEAILDAMRKSPKTMEQIYASGKKKLFVEI
jgi:hypothetical protein